MKRQRREMHKESAESWKDLTDRALKLVEERVCKLENERNEHTPTGLVKVTLKNGESYTGYLEIGDYNQATIAFHEYRWTFSMDDIQKIESDYRRSKVNEKGNPQATFKAGKEPPTYEMILRPGGFKLLADGEELLSGKAIFKGSDMILELDQKSGLTTRIDIMNQ